MTDLLTLANVESAYGPIKAIRGVSLKAEEGRIVTVLGSNGAGKSTILKTISGVRPVTSGRITFDGTDITGTAPHKLVEMGIC